MKRNPLNTDFVKPLERLINLGIREPDGSVINLNKTKIKNKKAFVEAVVMASAAKSARN